MYSKEILKQMAEHILWTEYGIKDYLNVTSLKCMDWLPRIKQEADNVVALIVKDTLDDLSKTT